MPFPEHSSLIRLSHDTQIKPFDCGDLDLNEFFNNDSKNYSLDLLTVTYLLESAEETIAFYSLLNDKIQQQDVHKWNNFRRRFKNNKRFHNYPAMKIGRLGVATPYQKAGIGKAILDYIKIMFVTNNRTGCRFITVDAYKASVGFYQNNGFLPLTESDANDDTRLMYFDLKPIAQLIQDNPL